MPMDTLATSIDLYKQSQSTVTSLWGLYSGAALALLGYILGSKNPVPGRGKIGLAVVFLIFALSNAGSLWRADNISGTQLVLRLPTPGWPHIPTFRNLSSTFLAS